MRQSTFQCLRLLIIAASTAASAMAAETRTYEFLVDGSKPYTTSCGECGGGIVGTRADVTGTFTVTFDVQAGTGSLVGLNDQFVNFQLIVAANGGTYSVPVTEPITYGMLPPYLGPLGQLPLDGVLTREGDVLRLTSDGTRPLPGGGLALGFPAYAITMTGRRATFAMDIPIIDNGTTVKAIQATLIPEPGAAAFAAFAIVAGSLRRQAARGKSKAT